MKHLKSLFKNPIFNVALIALITFLVYQNLIGSDLNTVVDSIRNSNVIYILFAVLAQLLSIGLTGYVLYKIGSLFQSKMSLSLAIQASFVGAMGAGIMPLGSGAQLFQFYLFNQAGLDNNNVVAMLWIEFILFQISLVITSLVLIVLNFPTLLASNFLVGVLVGFGVTSFVLIGLTLLSLSSKFYNLVIRIVSFIAKKLPLKIDHQEFEKNLNQQVDKFKDAIQLFKSNKPLIIRLIVINIIRMLLFLSVSTLIALAFGLKDISFLGILSGHIFVMMHNSFIPIPGQSGSTEFFFQEFLGPHFNELTTSVLVVWRFIQYYLVLIIGAIIFMFYKIRRRKTV